MVSDHIIIIVTDYHCDVRKEETGAERLLSDCHKTRDRYSGVIAIPHVFIMKSASWL